MLNLNAFEAAALVRNLDGLVGATSVKIERRDSLDDPCDGGFLVVRVTRWDGTYYEDSISDNGVTSVWTRDTIWKTIPKEQQ